MLSRLLTQEFLTVASVRYSRMCLDVVTMYIILQSLVYCLDQRESKSNTVHIMCTWHVHDTALRCLKHSNEPQGHVKKVLSFLLVTKEFESDVCMMRQQALAPHPIISLLFHLLLDLLMSLFQDLPVLWRTLLAFVLLFLLQILLIVCRVAPGYTFPI